MSMQKLQHFVEQCLIQQPPLPLFFRFHTEFIVVVKLLEHLLTHNYFQDLPVTNLPTSHELPIKLAGFAAAAVVQLQCNKKGSAELFTCFTSFAFSCLVSFYSAGLQGAGGQNGRVNNAASKSRTHACCTCKTLLRSTRTHKVFHQYVNVGRRNPCRHYMSSAIYPPYTQRLQAAGLSRCIRCIISSAAECVFALSF